MNDWLNTNRQPVRLAATLITAVALTGWAVGEPAIHADQQFAASRTDTPTAPAEVADAVAVAPQSVSFLRSGRAAASIAREGVFSGMSDPSRAPIWLHDGTTGESVTVAQSILAAHGWTISVDGDYGPQTEMVVTRFQQASGLLPDGIVGPVTWAALNSVRPAERGVSVAVGQPPVPPAPVDGVCDSWRPLVEAEGIPWDWALPIMQRESRCTNAHNGNGGTGDDSYGPFQVNRFRGYWGDPPTFIDLGAWFDASGYTLAVMKTPAGAIKAAGALYAACGPLPWQKPNYGCSGDGQLRRYVP